jgi:(methylthio)acryloyl-CoA hydratase
VDVGLLVTCFSIRQHFSSDTPFVDEGSSMPADPQLVSYEIRGRVAMLGLNRTRKRNAISETLLEELAELAATANAEAKAVVLWGAGEHFSAGLDLAEHRGRDLIEGIANSRRWHEVFAMIESAPVPWVAAMQGGVIGGGMELAAATHLRVADENTYFALPEGQRGIFVGGGGSVRIARLIGAARMTDMMLTGRVATAAEAERWNFVHYLARPGEAIAKAVELAEKTAENASFSNYAIINALPRIQDMSRADGLFVESMIAAVASATPEAGERLRDFVENRAAKVERPKEN